MGPTTTSEVPGCLQYYTVQSGDDCSSIETKLSYHLRIVLPTKPQQYVLFFTYLHDGCVIQLTEKLHSRL